VNIPEEVIERVAWVLIEDDTDTADRGVTREHYAERLADTKLIAPAIAEWARREALKEAAELAMRTGDARIEEARSEQDRGRSLRPDRRKVQLAEDHAWALRNQADGLWEAASSIRALLEGVTDEQ
jgi:hypothetical protein